MGVRESSEYWDIKKSLYGAHLAAAAAKHNAADHQREAQQNRYDITEAGKEGRRIGRWRKHRVDHSGSPPGKLLHDISAGVDHRADSRRRGTEDRQAFFGGPKTRLRQMLGRSPTAEPRIVGRIEDEGR